MLNMGGKQSLIENVAAIDFGTTNSGYAYCLGKYNEIKTNPNWSKNKGRILTDILLDGNLVRALAFGPTALREYARAVQKSSDKTCAWSDSDESVDYQAHRPYGSSGAACKIPIPDEDLGDAVLLEKIKLQILDLRDATNFQVTAVNREKVHAVQAFAPALEYMKQCCMEQIERDNDDLEGRDILWIVTVPASWESEQRNFMAMAALRSGVMSSGATKNFIIVTESEASAYFCRALKPKDFTDPDEAKYHDKNENYIVVDAGGGTVDITLVLKSGETGEETEAHESSGGRWGGETVNERFVEYIFQQSPMIRDFKQMYDEPVELWGAFMDDYNATKLRFHGNENMTITLKKNFVELYQGATRISILDEFAKNSDLAVNKEDMSVTFKAENLRRKEFDKDFQNLKETFTDAGHKDTWDEFDREFKRQKKRFDSTKDRQSDVEIKLDDDFLNKYRKLKKTKFGTGPGIRSHKSYTRVWFNTESNNLVIPSYAMKWCHYDDIIHRQYVPLEKLSKHRAWIWRKFMKSFERAKRRFNGEEDIEMALDETFLEEFHKANIGAFGADLDRASGLEYSSPNKLKISQTIMKDKCFHPITSKIVNFLREFYGNKTDVGILYLVGGFGQQIFLQNVLKNEFKNLKVLIPKDAHSSVMKGAINFAYSRVSTTEHEAKCTFSVGKRRDTFGEGRTTSRDISQQCTLVTLVERGEKVKVSQIVQQETLPYQNEEYGDKWVIEIFVSSSRGPKLPSKAKPLCHFKCRNGNIHVVTISFTATDVRFHVNEKDTGNSKVKKISQAKLESTCTVL